VIKTIRKHWRKSSNFNSAIIASMIVSYFFGKYIAVLYGQDKIPIWTSCWLRTLIISIALIVILIVSYFIYTKIFSPDLIDQQIFFDNFFISLVVVVTTTLMVLYNTILPQVYFWLLAFVVITILYFPLNFLYIKLRPEQ
jgi:hypothetical protein